jgi:dolichyl-phosphate-mannose--protein O-mannosyl transferase
MTQYHENAVYFQLRTIPALFSSLVAPVLYLAMRFSGLSCWHSLFAGVLVLTDTTILIQGRFILTDGPLHFFFVFAIAVCQFTTTLGPLSRSWVFSLVVTSIAFAFAVSTKMTAGGLLVFILFSFVISILRHSSLRNLFRWSNVPLLIPFAVSPALIYSICCYIHTILGVYHSRDSRSFPPWATGGIRDNVGDPVNRTAWLSDPMFYFRFRQILMFPASYKMSKTDDKSSLFYDWPLLKTPWFGFDDKDRRYSAAGQPFLWPVGYGVVILASCTVVVRFLRGEMTEDLVRSGTFAVGFWASFLPFTFVTRTTYVYHYALPSIMAICTSVSFIQAMFRTSWGTFVGSMWCFLSLFGLYLFSPLVYGATSEEVGQLCWYKRWCV